MPWYRLRAVSKYVAILVDNDVLVALYLFCHQLGNDDEDDASDEESTEQKQMAASPPQTYSGMAVKAVAALDDRQGSSLLAIRKYIQANFPPPSKLSTNAFNSLTLKGCMKAVARRELDNIRGLTFKLSKKERERQRLLQEQERERQRAIEERKARKAGKVNLESCCCLVLILQC